MLSLYCFPPLLAVAVIAPLLLPLLFAPIDLGLGNLDHGAEQIVHLLEGR